MQSRYRLNPNLSRAGRIGFEPVCKDWRCIVVCLHTKLMKKNKKLKSPGHKINLINLINLINGLSIYEIYDPQYTRTRHYMRTTHLRLIYN